MSEAKPRLTRLTAILTQLQSKRLITANEIAQRHKVSIRTIYRDIRTLEQSGVPIMTEEGRGYRLMEGYQLPPVMFTEAEANALITAQQIIANNADQSLAEQYQLAIDKVKSILQYQQKDKSELLAERMEVRMPNVAQKTSNYLMVLQLAITNYKILEIDYLSLQEKATKRTIEPFALIHTQGNNWVLVAHCQLRAAFRIFRLDRIRVLQETGNHFEPHELTLQQYFEEARKKWQQNQTPDIGLTSARVTFVANQKISTMKKVTIASFQVIGIKVKTANDGSAAQDIPQLWQRFMSEQIAAQIPNKISEEIFCIYTNYEGDHTQPYDTILGCKVSSLDSVPAGLVGQSFGGGNYVPFVSKGDMINGALYQTWLEIWKTDLKRTYTADFEVHGLKAMNPNDAEVDIFVAVE